MRPAFKRGRRLFTSRTSIRVTIWLAKGVTGTLNSFNLKDMSKHLFCSIGVPVGEVQLAPLSLPCSAHGQLATPPSWYRRPTRHVIKARRRFAMLPLIPPAFERGWRLFEGGIYSRKYGTSELSTESFAAANNLTEVCNEHTKIMAGCSSSLPDCISRKCPNVVHFSSISRVWTLAICSSELSAVSS